MADESTSAAAIPDSLTIVLRKPLDHGGISYATLELREPTADEWTRWDGKSGVEADIIAVSTIAGIPVVAAGKLGTRDLLEASRYIARFLA